MIPYLQLYENAGDSLSTARANFALRKDEETWWQTSTHPGIRRQLTICFGIFLVTY